MTQRTQSAAGLVVGLALAFLPVGKAGAQVMMKDRIDNLADRSVVSQKLTMSGSDSEALENARSLVAGQIQDDWQAFQWGAEGDWHSFVDTRSGRINFAEGAGIPWVPGTGNRLQAADIAGQLQGKKQIDLAVMEAVARGFLPRVASVLGVDPKSLVLSQGRSGRPAPYLWYVDFDVTVNGTRVEGANVVFRVNNGNLIQFGTENVPALGTRVPPTKLSAQQALAKVGEYIGGFEPGDRMLDRGSFHYFPTNVLNAKFNEGFEPGKGRGLAAVYEVIFKRSGTMGTWRARVDATSGDVLEFYDINDYAAASGGTYQSDRPAAETVLPLPFTNLSTGGFTNSGGVFTASGTPSTTLAGQYVKIVDSCGAISKAADGSGNIALGSSTGTDCITPGSGGAGNTHASRTQFYNVNRAKEVGRGWLPSNSWLNAQLTVNVNLNQTCNAYWDGVSTLNFFKSGGGCANTGELPGVSLHEWGHGLDSNDGNGSSADNGTGETYGDFSAALATHNSCIGNGFLGSSNCGGYGDACTACSGVRDIDYAKHAANTPSTVANFTQTKCPQPSANNPNYVGPCGKDAIARGTTTKKREGHCESVPISQALWDLANRDLTATGLSLGASWAVTDRLWYLSRSTTTKGFVCNVSGTTWTSTGCDTNALFRTLRAVDDDNGNLADGTPHGGAIAAAFNRHGFACTTDTAWNTTFAGCSTPAAPSLSATPGNNSAALSWSGSTGVYDVYRNERGCSAGFVKIGNDVSASSFNDAAVANGITYYYQVVAQPSGNEACGSAPSTCVSVTPAVVVTPDFAISASPTSVSVVQGNSGSSTVSTTVSGGFNNAVALSASGAPAGVTVSFSPSSIAAPGSGSSTATFAVGASTAAGTYPITITGTGGSTTHSTSVSLTVTTVPTPDFTISASPSSTSIAQGGAGNVTISTGVSGGFNNAVALSASGVPANVTVAFSPTSIAAPGSGSSTMTITVGATATAGTSTITVTGTGGSTTHSTSVSLTVTTSGTTVLTKGVAVTGISDVLNGKKYFSLAVPAGSTNLTFTMSGGTGDADMYVKFGAAPTLTVYDCRPYLTGNAETCTIPAPSTGTYYVMLNAYAAYSGVSLVGNYTAGGGGGSELLTNGGFEASSSPWVLSGATWSTGAYPHSGTGYLIDGGANNAAHTGYQTITIPSGTTPSLSFWLNVTSEETTTTIKYDFLYVEVRNTSGTLLATLATYSNLDKGTAGVYSQKVGLSLAAYAGQTVRIQFRGTTDTSLITSFRIDDVSAK